MDIQKTRTEQPFAETELHFRLSEEKEDAFLHGVEKKENGPLEFKFGELTLFCPVLAMKEGLHDCVSVRDQGKLLVNAAQCTKTICFPGALTELSLQNARAYWEIDVSYQVKAKLKNGEVVCSAGVTNCMPTCGYLGGTACHSWCVEIRKQLSYDFVCWHGSKRVSSLPVYPDGSTHSGALRLGFYLDCIGRTFTILDCTHNRVLNTFRDVDISRPLSPAVAAYGYKCVDVSVRLRTAPDISTLLTCLCNM